jgi:TonB dependent receptor-like, beta-barrel/Carboxypeptidase regulatory-like domain
MKLKPKRSRRVAGASPPVSSLIKWYQAASVFALVIFAAIPVFAQHERGELRLEVQDPKGGPLAASVELVSEASQVRRNFATDQSGDYVVRELPFGVYHLRVSYEAFLPAERIIEVRSEIPLTISVTLGLAPVQSRVNVTDSATLIDPRRTTTAYSVGPQAIRETLPAQPSRALTDLVDSEPGWLYEANGVLHPRGSEYDVQFVINGLPLTENRSPAFAPPLESENVESMRVMTAGFPAEYGRKLGGVIEVTAPNDVVPGLHLTTAIGGGSFSTVNGYAGIGYGHGASQFTLTGDASATDRYLDPPVIANYTNRGSTGGVSGTYSRDLTSRDRLQLFVRHDQIRYLVPNELVQQEAGQRQDSANEETSGQADYQRILTPSLLLSAEGSVREQSFRLWSNDRSTPVIIDQQRGFRQGYGRVTLAGHHGIHDWKLGVDTLYNPVHEALQYLITDPSLFDPGTALRFNFLDRQSDFEPSAFVQDELHLKNWNLSLGVRYDYYSFVVNESAVSPRVAVSHYFSSVGVLVHASYDRVFQNPAIENLLLASSPEVNQIGSLVLRLPVRPARGSYYEVGLTKGFGGRLRFDANVFRRDFRNYSDDNTLLNTGVSFPIADASAWIEGVEAKLELPGWGRFSGFLSYANQLGVAQGPITGGLFIGSQAIANVPDNSRFPVSQDQRNTGRAQLRFQASKRLWLAADGSYGSGLPVELDTGDSDPAFLLAQYGAGVLSQVDFARGRVRPSYSLDASAGVDLYRKDTKSITFQVQGSNLTNHLNVINFASLFSGTAIAIPRGVAAQMAIGF